MILAADNLIDNSITDLFTDWDIPPLVTCALALTAIIYTVGWVRVRRSQPKSAPDRLPPWRLAAFLGGILALFAAVASPLDTFSESLLFMHMSQHFVLMSIAPPLVVLGAPVVPMLRGLPRWFVRWGLGPFLRNPALQSLTHFSTRLPVAWIVMNIVYLGWHIPAAYEFALSSESWHNVEHACFFFSSVLFWWPVIEPWPFKRRSSSWFIIPYLLFADIVNTGLSAYLCFTGTLIYPSYNQTPRPLGLSALNDQIAAGALMWVLGSIIFLIPAVRIIFVMLAAPAAPPKWNVEHPSPNISPAGQA